MIKKLLLWSLVFFLLISSVSAYDYIFEKDTNISIRVPCFDSNSNPCNGNTKCYLSINYPNSSILISNKTMSFSPHYFDYNLSKAQTEILGEYSAITYCKGINSGFSTFHYLISDLHGINQTNNALSIITLVFLILILACFGFAFLVGVDERLRPLKILLVWFGALLLSPFFYMCKISVELYSTRFAEIITSIFLGYNGFFILFTFVMFLKFFNEVMNFFKESIKGIKKNEGNEELI